MATPPPPLRRPHERRHTSLVDASTSTTDGLTRRQVAARQLEVWRRCWLLAARRSSCRAPPRSSSTARPVPANYLRKAAAIAVAVVGLRRSDCCADAPAELTLSWRLSLTGGRLDDRRDTCTRADMNVSISFVLLSMVVAKMCLRTVPDPIAGRGPRAHQTPFQPPRLLQGAPFLFRNPKRRAR